MTLPKNVLFLCTGNSARSILAEAALNQLGAGRFRAYSAGSCPTGAPNPFALALLAREGIDTGFARSKSWDEFALPAAPKMDFIFTVCDSAAAEACPYWPGHPASAHWGQPDPAAVTGDDAEKTRAFDAAWQLLTRRITVFAALRINDMEAEALKRALQEIGMMT